MSTSASLGISWEWEPAGGMKSPELAGTFARLELKAGEDFVTLVEDRASGSSRRAIHVSLYPLAEWIVFNWWFLRAHSRPARDVRGRDGRHSMRSSADGFLWPDLSIVPEGARTRISWVRDRRFADGATLKYLTQGEILVDSTDLQFALSGLVAAVIDRLVELDVQDTPLSEEWRAIQSVDDDERDFCLASARLGLDPYSEAAEYESAIVAAAEELPSSILGFFYDAVSPRRISQTLGWVSESLREVSKSEGQLDQRVLHVREELRRVSLPRYHTPWTVGWRQASLVREALDVDPSQIFDIAGFVKSVSRPSGERRIQAAGRGGATTTSLVVLGHRYALTSQRFTLARAFWHMVASGEPEFLVIASYAESQKVERAFAAELLAPARGISDALGSSLADVQAEEIEEVAEKYQVSATVVEHQLHNQVLGADG